MMILEIDCRYPYCWRRLNHHIWSEIVYAVEAAPRIDDRSSWWPERLYKVVVFVLEGGNFRRFRLIREKAEDRERQRVCSDEFCRKERPCTSNSFSPSYRRNRPTCLRTDRQTDRQTDSHTDRQADRHTDKRTGKRTDIPTDNIRTIEMIDQEKCFCIKLSKPTKTSDAEKGLPLPSHNDVNCNINNQSYEERWRLIKLCTWLSHFDDVVGRFKNWIFVDYNLVVKHYLLYQ